ncbi:MAG: tetratricopeptide repeat protein [Blastocatellia bacterium]
MNGSASPDKTASEIAPELLVQMLHGSHTPAECLGISRATLYRIAHVGYRLLCAGRLEQARQIYEGLVAADPRDSVFHCHLGAVYFRLGWWEKARAEFNQSLAANPCNIEALAGRGEIALIQQRFAAAWADLAQAIRLDPNVAKAASCRARTLLLTLQQAATKPSAF